MVVLTRAKNDSFQNQEEQASTSGLPLRRRKQSPPIIAEKKFKIKYHVTHCRCVHVEVCVCGVHVEVCMWRCVHVEVCACGAVHVERCFQLS